MQTRQSFIDDDGSLLQVTMVLNFALFGSGHCFLVLRSFQILKALIDTPLVQGFRGEKFCSNSYGLANFHVQN